MSTPFFRSPLRAAALALLLAGVGLASAQGTRSVAGGPASSAPAAAPKAPAAAQGDIAALQRRIQQLTSDNEALHRQVTSQQNTIETLRSQQAQKGKGSNTSEAGVAALAAAGGLALGAAAEKSQLDAASRRNADLKNQLDAASQRNADLKNRLDAATQRNNDLKNQLDGQAQRDAALAAQNAELGSQVADLHRQIASLEAQVQALKQQLGDAAKRIRDLDSARRDTLAATSQARADAAAAAARADSAQARNDLLERQVAQDRHDRILWAALAAAIGVALSAAGVRLWWPRVTHVVKPVAVSVRLGHWGLAAPAPSHPTPNLAFNVRTQWTPGTSSVQPAGVLVGRPTLVEPQHQEAA